MNAKGFALYIRLILGLTLIVGQMASPAMPAYAAGIITVNTLNDNTTGDAFCSLREAITNANDDAATFSDCSAGSGNDTIIFDGNSTITLASQLPAITSTVTITGNGTADTIIQANTASNTATYRVLEVNTEGNLTLDNLAVQNGRCSTGSCDTYPGVGGGILNNGTLTVTNSTLSGNSAVYAGGIFNNNGTLTILNSTFSGNVAAVEAGGGVYNQQGTLTITDSTFSSNAARWGGGINNQGTLTITNSTFSNNSSSVGGGGIENGPGMTAIIVNSTFFDNVANSGGGIYNHGALTITNSTFSGNSATGLGSGVFNEGTLNLNNTILANSISNMDCFNNGGMVNGNNNLIEATDSNACGLNDGSDGNIIGFDPDLGALIGLPAYFPLNTGSLAFDTGSDTICAAAPVNNTSQNGATRPQGPHCDIGSFEFPSGDITSPTVSSIIRANNNPTNAASVDFTVTFSESVTGVDIGDFALSITDITGTSVTGVSGSGATYTVSVNTGSGDGTIRLDVSDDDSIVDGASNPLGGSGSGNGDFTSGESYTKITLLSTRYVATTGVDTGYCNAASTPCATITYAILQAFTGNTIEIAAGTYTEAGITIDKDLTLNGAGATSTFVQAATSPGTASDRVFDINSGITATIEAMTIRYGNISTYTGGGGIDNFGTLTLNNSEVSDNSAYLGSGIFNLGMLTLNNSSVNDNSGSIQGATGGGIYNNYSGTLTLNNSTVSGNSVAYYGGGIYNAGELTLNASTVSNNSAGIFGGGLRNNGATATMMINNSTVSGNSAIAHGGGISLEGGTVMLNYSTVANNISDDNNDGFGDGGGILNGGGTVNLRGSIVAGNKKGTTGISAANADCSFNSITSQGYNMTGSGTGCNLSGTGDVTVVPADVFTDVLDGLADNGGATQTHALIIGSSNPALNAIPNGTYDCGLSPFDHAQRGEARPLNVNCDIGAYEAALNTPAGPNAQVLPADATTGAKPVTLTFSQVTQSGITSLTISDSGPTLPSGFNLGTPPMYYELSTTATFVAPVTICISYTGVNFGDETAQANLTLNHYESGAWENRTTLLDTANDVICGTVNSLSPFAIFEPVAADQTITVTTSAPASATNGSSFTVSATASSGLPVTYSASGACTNTGDTFTMVYGFGDCTVYYDQEGSGIYNPAPQVTEIVADANDAPIIAEGDSIAVTMSEDGLPTTFALTLNVTDPDYRARLAWRIITAPLHGRAFVSAPPPASGGCKKGDVCLPGPTSSSNAISYSPDMDYTGSDSFDVQVSDGTLTDTITVNVTIDPVNDAPVITESDPQAVTMSRDGSPNAFDLILHATDIDGDPLTWSIFSPASYGTATTTPGAGDSNVIGYTPTTGYVGTDSFVVEVSDGDLTAIITVNVTIEVTIIDQTITVTTNAPTSAVYGSSFTVAATASSGLPVTYSSSGSCTNMGADFTIIEGFGTCTVYYDQDGDASYNPAPQVTETVADANDTPVIYQGDSIAVTIPEDGSLTKTFSANDLDYNDTLTWSILSSPLHGTASIVPPRAAFLPAPARGNKVNAMLIRASVSSGVTIGYDPVTNYNGTDSFIVEVSDGNGGTDMITVNVTVDPVNDDPVITEGSWVNVTMSQGSSPTAFNLTLNAIDVDGDTLTWDILPQASNGTANVTGTGYSRAIAYAPHSGFTGFDYFAVQVDDGNGGIDYITVNVTIRPVLTVTVNPQTIIYGDAEPSFTFTYSGFAGTDGPTNIDTPPTCGRVSAFSRNVGRYRIGCSGGVDDTYDFRYVDDELTINPKPITIRAEAKNKVYGNLDPALTYLVTSGALLASDSFSGDLTRIPGENAGDYDISQGTLTAGTNYNLTYIPAKLRITSKPITVTADAQSKVYGTVDPVLTYQVTSGSLESGDSFTGALTRVSGENVGIYAITQDTLTAGSNYSLAYVGANLTITKANQSITINTHAPTSAVVGSNFTVAASASSGLLITFSASGACSNTGATFTINTVGTCTVNYDQAGDSNYNAAPQVTETVSAISDTPSLLTPANGEQLLNNRPTFDWTDVSGATDYRIQISNNAGFTTTITNTVVTPSTYTPTSDLNAGVTLYWRVQANTATGTGPWSVVMSFITARPPSIPTLASPANNALVTNYTPLIDWNNSTVPAGTTFQKYELQLGTDSLFASPTSVDVVGLASNSQYTPPTSLDPNTTYYWRVRAHNTLGQYSSWSAVRSFRTALLPPTLIAPNDSAQLLNNRPTFDWADVPGVTGYRIQIANNVGFAPTLTNTGVTPSTYTPAADLPAGTTLYWRVQSNGTNGPSAWSVTQTLTTANPPSVPTLASPANNALTTDYTPLLDWNDSTIPAGTTLLKYELQLATDSLFTSPVSVDAVTSDYTPLADLNPNTTYYWRVRAYNTFGQYSAWSAVRNFRTALLPPILITPANASSTINRRPVFDWSDVTSATGYRIQISNNVGFTSTVTNTVVTPSTYTPAADLPAGTTLYWRVQSNGTNGPSAWSAIQTITTANPPSIPNLVSPANNAVTSSLTPLLDWSNSTVPAGTTFLKYELQISTDAGFTSPTSIDVSAPATNSNYMPVTSLNSNTTYYWRVRSYNTLGQYSSWSTVRTFTTP